MQKIILLEDIDTIASFLEEEVIKYIKPFTIKGFESFKSFSLINFEWYNTEIKTIKSSQILIYLSKEDVFIICEDKSTLLLIEDLLENDFKIENMLYHLFIKLIKGDSQYLEGLEEEITDMEDTILHGPREDSLNKIIRYRKELLKLKKYYDQLYIIVENLIANDNSILDLESIRLFNILENRIGHYQGNIINLRDYITQMREAYQAQIDIEQNELMKVFTLITALFLPLSLIVGWYGMNFYNMPEITWKYGYITIIILSIMLSTAMIYYFKFKKWL